MLSLPRNTATTRPSAFCGTDQFLCYHWAEGSGATEGNYLNYAGQNLERGWASWIKFDLADTVTLTTGSAYGTSTFGLFLEEGWNQIANPYSFDVLWNDAFFYISGSTPVTVGQSRQEDRPKGLWAWDPVISGYVYRNPQVRPAVMRPWSGYWVYASRSVSVYFPGRPYFVMDTAAAAPRAAQAPDGWRVQIGVRQGAATDGDNYFGVTSRATSAVGPEDTDKPPTPFTHLTLDLGDGLCEDFRGAGDYITWRATVAHPAAGPATIIWQNVPAVPAAYRLYLYDADAEAWTDMRAADAYTLAIKSAAQDRTLTIVATTRSDFMPQQVAAALRVVAITPHPFEQGAMFRWVAPADAWPQPATLEIFSLAGTPVCARRTTDASCLVTWDGKSSTGAALGAGIYTYRLTVGRYMASGKLIKAE